MLARPTNRRHQERLEAVMLTFGQLIHRSAELSAAETSWKRFARRHMALQRPARSRVYDQKNNEIPGR